MAYLVDEAKGPPTFVKEKIPESFMASFSPTRLYTPLGTARWPTNEWVIDKARNVALVGGGTNGNFAADERIPETYWKTLLVDGSPVGLLYNSGTELLEGSDPVTQSRFFIDRLENLHLYLPPALYGRKDEIVRLVEEAMYVRLDGPILPWVRGVVAEVAGAHLDTEYKKVKHHGIA